MARKVHVHSSYARDVLHLSKLAIAVEQDKRQPVEWRQDVLYQVNDLMSKLSDASTAAMGAVPPAGTKKAAGGQ